MLSRAIVVVLCIVASLTVSVCVTDSEAQGLFALFLQKYNKAYGADLDTYKLKYEIFKLNLARVQELNARPNQTAVYGVTKFMDLTPAEFKNMYLSKILMKRPEHPTKEGFELVENYPLKDLPTNFNWKDKGAVTKVKDQGSCGSCWAFSTTGNVEGQWFLAGNNLTSLSEQHLVDCDRECDPDDPQSCDDGCDGGLMMNAFTFVMKNNGIATEKSYPYKGSDGKCKKSGIEIAAKIDGKKLLGKDEPTIRQFLYDNGPLAVALNADDLQFYSGGVLDDKHCDPEQLDHGVLMVGFGKEGAKEFYVVKNSWGADWGENGFFRIAYGKGMCGINTYVCTSVVNKKN